MKTIVSFFLIIFLLISCTDERPKKLNKSNIETSESTSTIEGTWELVGFYNFTDNEISDSFKTNEGYKQVKMFTSTKVMWSKHVPSDSTEWFGYGSYKIDQGKLIEILDYGSEIMNKIIQEKKEFNYELVLAKNTFSQIELDDDGNRIYSENYIRIE